MPFGLVLSFLFHAALLGWALFSMRSVSALTPDTPAIAADIITPSEFLRLKQGSEDAKNLETKAKDEPKPDDSKNDTAKPSNAPPPPPPPPAAGSRESRAAARSRAAGSAAEPPKPAPDPIAKKIEEPPPPPEPAPGPTPDEKKLLEQKLEEEHKAEEAKKKAEEEAKKKAEDEAKKKAEEAERKKKHAEELKKKKQQEAKKKAEAAKKKFDASKIASLLEKAPDDAPPKALLDKDPRKKGQQAAGTSTKSDIIGKEAGTATGHGYGAFVTRAGSPEGYAQIAAQRLLAAAWNGRRQRRAGRRAALGDEPRRHPRRRAPRHIGTLDDGWPSLYGGGAKSRENVRAVPAAAGQIRRRLEDDRLDVRSAPNVVNAKKLLHSAAKRSDTSQSIES